MADRALHLPPLTAAAVTKFNNRYHLVYLADLLPVSCMELHVRGAFENFAA